MTDEKRLVLRVAFIDTVTKKQAVRALETFRQDVRLLRYSARKREAVVDVSRGEADRLMEAICHAPGVASVGTGSG